MDLKCGTVDYESFGAKGDGEADDMKAICEAHAHASERGLDVRTRPDATYNLGTTAQTAVITTNTDWNTSRFIVDDSQGVEDHRTPLFEVRSSLEPVELDIKTLTRDQRKVDVRPERDCYVMVEKNTKRLYVRRGLNQNEGVPQHDCFILRRDGSIEADIDWEYDVITGIDARPMDDETLFIRGGVFNTFANRQHHPVGYNYWCRNIILERSNTEVVGLVHYVVGETEVGCPYTGFITSRQCANITLRNCFATGHRIYEGIGAAGKPVRMGTYDYNARNIVGFNMIGCRQNLITDKTRWGVIESSFCKNILLVDCEMSRMDTHMGVSGTYTIRRCQLGHMGLNAIGRGVITLEDSTLNGPALVNLRHDYGSTWEGKIVVLNCRWIPSCGDKTWPHLIGGRNDGMHDFGYPCFMPEEVEIDTLYVDDSNTPDDYDGMCFFTDPDEGEEGLPDERPFPYAPCERVIVKGLETASGKRPSAGQAGRLKVVVKER